MARPACPRAKATCAWPAADHRTPRRTGSRRSRRTRTITRLARPRSSPGQGWQPHEVVTLVFQEDPRFTMTTSSTVTADNEGKIYWDQWAPEEHDLNVRFYLTAQGSQSRAQMTFTDGYSVSVSVSAVGSSAMISHGRTNANNTCTGISMSSVSVGHGAVQGVGGTLGNRTVHSTERRSNGRKRNSVFWLDRGGGGWNGPHRPGPDEPGDLHSGPRQREQ